MQDTGIGKQVARPPGNSANFKDPLLSSAYTIHTLRQWTPEANAGTTVGEAGSCGSQKQTQGASLPGVNPSPATRWLCNFTQVSVH